MSEFLLDFVNDLVGSNSEDAVELEIELDSWEVNAIVDGVTNETDTYTDDYDGEDQDDNDDFCIIPTEIFDDFTAEEFSNTKIIQWMHSFPPRFDHSKNVLDLMIGTEAEQQDYVRGLFAPATFLLVFFTVWAFLLLLFKWLAPSNGSNSYRWLGGQPLRLPSPPLGKGKHYNPKQPDTYEVKEWKKEYTSTKYQLSVFRIVVWVAGLSITIAALVMSVYGVDSLTNTLEAGRESIGIVKSLAGDANSIVESVIQQNQNLSQKLYGLLDKVNGMCPLVRDPLCDDIYNITTCDISSILGGELNGVFQTAAGHFVDGDESEYYQEIVNAKNGLEDVGIVSTDIDRSASHLNWALSLSMVMSLLLAMLCILILCGLVCPEVPKVLQLIRSKFMIPAFVVLVVFAFLFSLVFVTASVATADVCVYKSETDNIDERLTTLLTRSETVEDFLGGKETQNLVVEFISFYIHQCPIEMLPSEILDQLDYVKAGVPVVRDFGAIVNQSTDLIRGVCGFRADQTQGLVDVADTLQEQLCSLAAILSDIRDFVQCGNWYPLYETTVYEALCYDGTKGFAYVATTQFVIVFMAFVILTFRVAFWDVEVGDEYFDFVDDGSSCSGSISGEESPSGFQYYGDLRNKLGKRGIAPPPSEYSCSVASSDDSEAMELRMNRLRERQPQQQLYPGNSSVTTSLSSSREGSPLPPSPSLPPRNSVYPSRKFRPGEDVVVSPTRLAAMAANSIRHITTTFDSGDDCQGIEVIQDFCNGNNSIVIGSPPPSPSSSFHESSNSGGMKTNRSFPSKSPRAVHSTALWMKHGDNIDYFDSDDSGHDSYWSSSVDSDDYSSVDW